MKSVRLTNNRREVILSNLLKDKFIVPIDEFKEKQSSIAEDVYTEFFGRAAIKRMYSLPRGWMEERPTFSAKLGGYSHHFTVGEDWKRSVEYKEKCYQNRWCVRMPTDASIMLPADHKLSIEYQKAEDAKAKINESRAHAYAQASSVLLSVSTLKRLMEVWPEVGPYVPADMYEEQVLPTLPIQSLNETFGLSGDK